MKWTTSQTKMTMGTMKVNPKKDICHLTLTIEILMQHFFLNTNQLIPLKVIPTRMQEAFTSRVNTSKLKERLYQTKLPLASSNGLHKLMQAKKQKIIEDLEEEEEEERPLMIKRRKQM